MGVTETSELILKHFFVFDSEHLDEVKPAFYGYTFLDDEIVTDDQGLAGREPGKEGVYVYISRDGNRIRLSQDFMGCYGLYLYRKDDYFAISNSLLMLTDFLKENEIEPLTLNKEFADYMLCTDLASSVYGETLVREITFLDRSAVVEIDAGTKTIAVSEFAYEENIIEPDTAEGIAVLDAWRGKWVRRFRNIAAQTTNIVADLSGGFDTRLVLCLLLSSGIDLDRIKIYSIRDELHTHQDDYRIAQLIAQKYDFELNRNDHLQKDVTPLTMGDILKISFYSKLGCHKELYYKRAIHQNTRYSITGSAGGCIRGFLNEGEDAFIQDSISRCSKLAGDDAGDSAGLSGSVENVLRRSFRAIRGKYDRLGMIIREEDLAKTAYLETRCRNHFGKANMEKYIENVITLSPLLDPDLYRLKSFSGNCGDPNLLAAIIFERYAPGLAEIEIQGGRSIDQNTIAYAKKVNRDHPRIPQAEGIKEMEAADESNVHHGRNGAKYGSKEADELILSAFQTEFFHRAFITRYSEHLYNQVLKSVYLTKFHPLSNLYIGFGIVLIILPDNGGVILETIGNSLSRELEEKLADALRMEEAYRDALLENERLRQELEDIRQSGSYRAGNAILTPVRKIRALIGH